MTTPPEGGRPEDGNEGASPSARRSGTFWRGALPAVSPAGVRARGYHTPFPLISSPASQSRAAFYMSER